MYMAVDAGLGIIFSVIVFCITIIIVAFITRK